MQESLGPSYVPVFGVPSSRRCCPDEPDAHAQPPAREWRSDVMLADRKLRGLGAVLEALHASHLDVHDGADEQLLGEHLVEGLMIVGRDLVQSARDALRGVV